MTDVLCVLKWGTIENGKVSIFDFPYLSGFRTRISNLKKKVFQNGKCRKLTPLEYERLQTVPDNYTACLSNTQRYKSLGNGWTIDVIAHILKYAFEK